MKKLLVLLGAALAFSAQAQIPLQQSTASQAVKFGPFVDSTDGNTEETALTIANTDVHLSKNGGTIAAKNSGGCTHDANGWYTCTFDATDTNTAGRLTAYIHVSGALPVFREFMVYPTANYAAMYSTAPGASGGLLISGTNSGTTTLGALTVSGATTFTGAVTGSNASNNFRINGVAPGASGGVFIAGTNAATSVTTALTANITGNLSGSVGSVTGAVGSVTGNVGGNVTGSVGSVTGAVGSVTGNVGGNVTGTVGGFTTGALADLFDTDSGTTYASAVAGSVVKEIADNAGGSALTVPDIAYGQGVETTTIATLASQTSFTLTAGSADDNAYNGYGAKVIDSATSTQSALGCVNDYTGTTKTITLKADPGIFTMAAGDTILLMPAYCNIGVDVTTIETVDATDQLDAHAAAGLDAAGVRSAVGLASANLDTQLGTAQADLDTITGSDGVTLATTQGNYAPLKPTVAGRTLDVATTGEAGIDWGNIANKTTTNVLSGTTVGTVTTLTGNTPQTGDAYARLGAPAGASVSADIAAVKSDSAAILTDTGTTLDGKLDTVVSATAAAAIRTAIGLATANLDTQIGTLSTFDSTTDKVDIGKINGVTITGDGSATPFNVP